MDSHFSGFLQQFATLNEQQKHDLIFLLMSNTEVYQLRQLFCKMTQLLSFDIVSHIPAELAHKVLSFLDVVSLCAASQCCHRWRELANSNSLWKKLCVSNDYAKFADLAPTQLDDQSRPTSPSKPKPNAYQTLCTHNLSTLSPLCKWKMVFIKAYSLDQNWKQGVYFMLPLLKGHRLPVTTISCDGEFIVSGSGDGSVCLWSLLSFDCLHLLEGHTDAVNTVVVKDGLIITGCSDGLVRVFDSRTGQRLMALHGHNSSVEHVAFDGRTIISGGCDCTVRVWDVYKGNLLHSLTGHTEDIECLMLVRGHIAVSGSWDYTLRVWDIQSGICKHILVGHTEGIYCCSFHGSRVVSGGADGTVKVWDLDSGGAMVANMTGHTQEVLCLQSSADIVASGSADSTVRLWTYSGFCLHVLEGHIGIVRCIELRGHRLISGGDRKRIIIWNVDTPRSSPHLQILQELLA